MVNCNDIIYAKVTGVIREVNMNNLMGGQILILTIYAKLICNANMNVRYKDALIINTNMQVIS